VRVFFVGLLAWVAWLVCEVWVCAGGRLVGLADDGAREMPELPRFRRESRQASLFYLIHFWVFSPAPDKICSFLP
jgi:hypothetical protein